MSEYFILLPSSLKIAFADEKLIANLGFDIELLSQLGSKRAEGRPSRFGGASRKCPKLLAIGSVKKHSRSICDHRSGSD